MAKKKEKQMIESILPKDRYIYGAFIHAYHVDDQRDDLNSWFDIKLSAINSIFDIGEDGCVFFTYKDCRYWVPLSAIEIRKAINSFIFEPETHWERYGN